MYKAGNKANNGEDVAFWLVGLSYEERSIILYSIFVSFVLEDRYCVPVDFSFFFSKNLYTSDISIQMNIEKFSN